MACSRTGRLSMVLFYLSRKSGTIRSGNFSTGMYAELVHENYALKKRI